MEQVLRVSGLTKKYKNQQGIQEIDFSMERGEIKGLLGPNGAGKTTLMKCMVGLTQPDGGQITILGNDLHQNYKSAIYPVGAFIGTGSLYDHLTAYQNLKLALRFYPNLSTMKVDEVLEKVGLSSFMHEKVRGYSMGMKQRLGLAAAIISKPALVILDEPANGLDIDGMILFRKVIKELGDDGVSVLISSHQTSELERICDTYAILMKGRLHEIGALHKNQSLEQAYLEKLGGDKDVNDNQIKYVQ